jgi:peptidoglycan/xylan/chitin deacetylase (PgdA/CDA1 family)
MHEIASVREAASGNSSAVRRLPLLTYHELTEVPSQDLYRVETRQFAQHLEMLSELYRRGIFAEHDWCLSFDDGHRSNAELALPLLQRHGLKAIFFITAGWTGIRNTAMSYSHLAELVSAGHSVQSHGWSHAFLAGCSPLQLEYELQKSKGALEDHLGVSVDSISMPGGRCNSQVLKACAAAGYQHVYTSDPVFEPVCEHGVWRHGRMMVRRNTQIDDLRQFLTGDPRLWSRLRRRHRIKQACRSVLGDAAYHALWQRLSAREKTEEADSASGKADGTTGKSNHAHTATD